MKRYTASSKTATFHRRWSCTLITIMLLLAGIAIGSSASAQTFAAQYRAFSGQVSQLLDIDPDGSVSREGTLFGIGGVFGLTFIDQTMFGVEFEAVDRFFLVTIPHTGTASGVRVGAVPIGPPNVEGLAYDPIGDRLFGVSFDTSEHLTSLLEIDRGTGTGTAIGTLSFDVFIVGLASSPTGTLYGVSKAYSGNSTPALYSIRTDGIGDGPLETLVGSLGLLTNAEGFGPIEGLTWADDKLVGSFGSLYEIDTGTGAATLIGGDYTTSAMSDGAYGLADLGGPSPVESTSWGRVKAIYRPGE